MPYCTVNPNKAQSLAFKATGLRLKGSSFKVGAACNVWARSGLCVLSLL